MKHADVIVRLFRAATFVTPYIPLPIAQTLAILVGSVVGVLPTAQNDRIRKNLGRVLGRPAVDPDVRRLARTAIRVQTLNYLDLFRAGGMTRTEVVDTVRFTGREHLQDAYDRGKGVVLVSAHYGSIDRLGLYLPAIGFPATAIVEPIDPPELLDIIIGQRKQFGGEPFPIDKDVSQKAAGYLKRGWLLGLTADWDLQGTGIPVPFFGHTLRMPIGPALFAIRYHAPIIVIYARRNGATLFDVEAYPLIEASKDGSLQDRIKATSVAISARVEAFIRDDPSQWVLFHDIWVDD